MGILGYIITDKKLRNIKKIVKVVSDMSEIEDMSKPILVVGINKAKELSGNNFNILNNKLIINYDLIKDYDLNLINNIKNNPNIYWTYYLTENREFYNKNIITFYNVIINNIINKIKYHYINVINLRYNNLKKLYHLLINSNDKHYIYYNNSMIYVEDKCKNNVYGVSLDILKYACISTEKVISKIKNNKNNVVINDDSSIIRAVGREIRNYEYSIPYFASMK